MIHKAYFYRYRQALERSLSSEKIVNKASEHASACTEERAPQKLDKNQPGTVEEQFIKMKEDAVKETDGSNAFHGFEQIAPGIFQFRQQAYGGKDYAVPPRLFPPFQSEVMHSQKAGELGFKRVDGLPGPYQHYSTPVFQFT